jgi:hypothetical protein
MDSLTKKNDETKRKSISKQILDFTLSKDKEESKKHCDELQENVAVFESKLVYNNKMIIDLEPSKKAIKDDLKHLIKVHRKFMLKLLKFGKDFRYYEI